MHLDFNDDDGHHYHDGDEDEDGYHDGYWSCHHHNAGDADAVDKNNNFTNNVNDKDDGMGNDNKVLLKFLFKEPPHCGQVKYFFLSKVFLKVK